MQKVDTIIFDLGNVLIQWDPRHLYRKILKDEEEVTWFLQNICTADWNDQQDAGRSFQEATEELIHKHPEWEIAIRAWYDRWQETIPGDVKDSVKILEEIKQSGRYKLYALTNWSAETFPWALENFSFLHWFEGIVVSGIEKKRKPFPEIFHLLLDRYKVDPARALFIDDNVKNIEGGKAVGLNTILFESPQQLRASLESNNIL
jgi:2-haloacid dehalogenase